MCVVEKMMRRRAHLCGWLRTHDRAVCALRLSCAVPGNYLHQARDSLDSYIVRCFLGIYLGYRSHKKVLQTAVLFNASTNSPTPFNSCQQAEKYDINSIKTNKSALVLWF